MLIQNAFNLKKGRKRLALILAIFSFFVIAAVSSAEDAPSQDANVIETTIQAPQTDTQSAAPKAPTEPSTG